MSVQMYMQIVVASIVTLTKHVHYKCYYSYVTVFDVVLHRRWHAFCILSPKTISNILGYESH